MITEMGGRGAEMTVEEILSRHPARVMYVRAGDLQVDRDHYQRWPERQKVAKIARRYNPLAAGVLLVSRRADGQYFLVDGQHRRDGIVLRFGEGHLVECQVVDGMTIGEEAEVFFLVNSERGPVKTLTKYRAALLGGEPQVVEIAAILDEVGIRYPWTGVGTHQDRHIVCWGALSEIHRRKGAAHLREVLSLIDAAWGCSQESLEAQFIQGVDLLVRFHSNDEAWSFKEATERLRRQNADVIARDAESLRGGKKKPPRYAIYQALHELYNKGRRTQRLHDMRTREPAGKATPAASDGS